MWLRLHTPPKICRFTERELWNVKQKYYFEYSFTRYSRTDDGIKVNEIAVNCLKSGAIGVLEI